MKKSLYYLALITILVTGICLANNSGELASNGNNDKRDFIHNITDGVWECTSVGENVFVTTFLINHLFDYDSPYTIDAFYFDGGHSFSFLGRLGKGDKKDSIILKISIEDNTLKAKLWSTNETTGTEETQELDFVRRRK
ncbi:hypothetical protein [Flavobacterium cerinum]|uniref:Lipocalin-like domain-containing protein n=1 Tax=Flavobacterium cerinum TaxID=2502784 RepID=A0ABY5IQ03_9FLAO|nr:hypothetical protein [Flavobacterium cerinum]UUC44844.1 hypothetical protein NOX80_14560 [Flavobacterium cerinum]